MPIQIARSVLQTYIREKRVITESEVNLTSTNAFLAEGKDAIFVTIYKDGKVIGSSGRIHPKKQNTLMELIDNTLQCLSDPRVGENIATLEDIDTIRFRIDHIRAQDRVIARQASDLDVHKHGIILLSEKHAAASVILPQMSTVATTGEDLFSLACLKAGVKKIDLKENEYIIYAFTSTQISDLS